MKETIEKFYQAFENHDAERMTAYYHKEIQFEDPAFGVLIGEKAKNMWRMLCRSLNEQGGEITMINITSNDKICTANWEAHYTFSKTGKKVHNIIKAEFEFKDGLIIKHTDSFDLYKWAKQALGVKGVLIGWTPFFKKKLIIETNRLLSQFEQKID